MFQSIKWPWSKSIAQRILWGFYVMLGLVLISTIMQWIDLSKLKWRLDMQEATTELVNNILEIRRYEKNWFLYRDKEAYKANKQLISTTSQLLDQNSEAFLEFVPKSLVKKLKNNLYRYQKLITREHELSAKTAYNSEVKIHIRRVGKEMVELAESFVQMERNAINKTLDTVYSSGVIFAIIVASVAIVLGQQLSNAIVKPLHQIVECTKIISQGHKVQCENLYEAEEIITVIQAFNVMLKELDKREKEITQSKKMAALWTLVAGVAHELNNPLSNIYSSCQILIEELEDEHEELNRHFLMDMLRDIVAQTERAKKTVNSLLEFSRDREFQFEETKLSKLIHNSLHNIRTHISPGIKIDVQIDKDGKFFCDQQKMEQAIVNILTNAVQALEGKGTITISGEVIPDENKTIISVSDDGPGIPPELQDKIFDPFFTTKDVGEGSGLGLAIVNETVTKHGGSITVESDVQKGTKFVITLPIKKFDNPESFNG